MPGKNLSKQRAQRFTKERLASFSWRNFAYGIRLADCLPALPPGSKTPFFRVAGDRQAQTTRINSCDQVIREKVISGKGSAMKEISVQLQILRFFGAFVQGAGGSGEPVKVKQALRG